MRISLWVSLTKMLSTFTGLHYKSLPEALKASEKCNFIFYSIFLRTPKSMHPACDFLYKLPAFAITLLCSLIISVKLFLSVFFIELESTGITSMSVRLPKSVLSIGDLLTVFYVIDEPLMDISSRPSVI